MFGRTKRAVPKNMWHLGEGPAPFVTSQLQDRTETQLVGVGNLRISLVCRKENFCCLFLSLDLNKEVQKRQANFWSWPAYYYRCSCWHSYEDLFLCTPEMDTRHVNSAQSQSGSRSCRGKSWSSACLPHLNACHPPSMDSLLERMYFAAPLLHHPPFLPRTPPTPMGGDEEEEDSKFNLAVLWSLLWLLPVNPPVLLPPTLPHPPSLLSPDSLDIFNDKTPAIKTTRLYKTKNSSFFFRWSFESCPLTCLLTFLKVTVGLTHLDFGDISGFSLLFIIMLS